MGLTTSLRWGSLSISLPARPRRGAGMLEFACGRLRAGDSLEFGQGTLLRVAVHGVALDKHGEVDAMRVELGTVDTSELALAVDQDAATAAHASAVDHDRVEADDGVDVFLACHLGDSLHHYDWAHGHNQVDAGAVLNQLAELVGDETFVGVATVVGGNHERIADGAHFRLEDDQFLVAGSDDRNNSVAGALQRCRRGIGHCGADSAADYDDRTVVFDLRGFAERAHYVENLVAGFKRVQQVRRLPCGLDDDVNGAAVGVRVLNGDRDAFALFIDAKDDELAGLLFAGDARRFDDEAFDTRRKEFGVNDFKHERSASMK